MMKHSSIGIAIALMAMMSPVPATGEVYLQGDTNGDGEINIGDVNVILNNILVEGEYDYHYDLAADSLINIGDVNDVLSRIITGEREWIRTAEDYVWDDTTTSLPELHISVPLDEWNRLLSLYDANPQTTQYVMANLRYIGVDGEIYDINDIGLRLKGNTSRRRPEGGKGEMHSAGHTDWHHAHFGLHLRKYVKDEEHTIQGVRKLHLKWFKDDPMYVREMFCYDLFRRAGIWTGSRDVYCRLWLHVEGDAKEAYYGVYEMLEPIDENWLKRRDTEDTFGTHQGNLWKCRYTAHKANLNSGYDGDYWYDDDSDDKHVYTLETNTKRFDNAKNQLIDFQLKLNGKKDDSFYKWINEVCDVDLLLHTYALSVAMGMWDDYWNNGNNYYLYFTTEDIYDYKVYFIPYDYDNTLGTTNRCGVQSDAVYHDPLNWGEYGSPLIRRLLVFDEYRALYIKYLKQAVDDANDLMHYNDATERIKHWQSMIKDYINNDTGEDTEIRDEPAFWGNHSEYRLLEQRNNYFMTRAGVLNQLK